jgi:hypothetical protein
LLNGINKKLNNEEQEIRFFGWLREQGPGDSH